MEGYECGCPAPLGNTTGNECVMYVFRLLSRCCVVRVADHASSPRLMHLPQAAQHAIESATTEARCAVPNGVGVVKVRRYLPMLPFVRVCGPSLRTDSCVRHPLSVGSCSTAIVDLACRLHVARRTNRLEGTPRSCRLSMLMERRHDGQRGAALIENLSRPLDESPVKVRDRR